jgi:hypothetical protein
MLNFVLWLVFLRLDKIARCLSVLRAKKTSWDKTAIFLSVWRQKKKTNQRTKLSTNGNIVVCKYII